MTSKRMFYIVVALGICLLVGVSSFNASLAKAEKITIKAISAWGKNHSGVVKDYLP